MRILHVAALGAVLLLTTSSLGGNGRKFYDDDPLLKEPETQDASGAEPWDIPLFADLAINLLSQPGDPTPNVRAQNINTIDEVPDSSWFTNRIGARPVSMAEAVRGPLTGTGPAPGAWSIVRAKEAGAAPGFTMRDSAGTTWFISLDARGYPEAATGAIMVANKIFWTLGYWQVENHLVTLSPDDFGIDRGAMVTPPSGRRRAMRQSDVEAVLRRAHRGDDGRYRAVAARALAGRPLGGFRYHGTRPDDPNDLVPHEHRRELRALRVFGAWTNLVDMKAGNTLDVLVRENGRGIVRHYLQDVGSTFGTGANAPHHYDEGWEHLYEGDTLLKRFLSLGLYIRPWQTVGYTEHPAIGRFEGVAFDPTTWRPRVPSAAFLRARPDDDFWAARRVAAFSDDLIRAVVTAGGYTDPRAAALLADTLIQRRDRITHAFLTAVNPVMNVELTPSGALTFENAATIHAAVPAPPAGYVVQWSTFDNDTSLSTPIGESVGSSDGHSQAPVPLAPSAGDIVKVTISAITASYPAWAVPVDAYFRWMGNAWALVGFERLP